MNIIRKAISRIIRIVISVIAVFIVILVGEQIQSTYVFEKKISNYQEAEKTLEEVKNKKLLDAQQRINQIDATNQVKLKNKIRQTKEELEKLNRATPSILKGPSKWAEHKIDILIKKEEINTLERLQVYYSNIGKPDHSGKPYSAMNPGTSLKPIDDLTEIHKELQKEAEKAFLEKSKVPISKFQDWILDKDDQLKASAMIVLLAILTPLVIKFILFFVFAPIAAKRKSKPLIPSLVGDGRFSANFKSINIEQKSSISCRLTVDPSTELLVHPAYIQSAPNECESRTKIILNKSIPFSCIAAGLYALTRIRVRKSGDVTLSSARDPLGEISLIKILDQESIALIPRYIVGVHQNKNMPLRITRHWLFFNMHSWLTFQFRHLVFHGPATLLVKGCRGVRIEMSEEGRSLNPAATMGFSTGLRYESRRCETFYSYLSGQKPLLNDSFVGSNGYYIYEEMPHQGKGGAVSRGIEGLIDALLKPFGI